MAVDAAPAGSILFRTSRFIFRPLQDMGMNAILVFFWHGTASAVLDAVYVAPPGHDDFSVRKGLCVAPKRDNLTGWIKGTLIDSVIADPAAAQLVYVLLKIACFFVATRICARVGYFWKI